MFAILGFYTKSYNYEKSIYAKYTQLSLFKNIIGNVDLSDSNKYDVYKGINVTYQFGKPLICKPVIYPNESLLVNKIRFDISNDLAAAAFPAISSKDTSAILRWIETADSLELKYTPGSIAKSKNDDFVITSKKATIKLIDFVNPLGKFGRYSKYLFLSIIFVLIVIFATINYWTQKVFLLGIIPKLRSNAKKLVEEMTFTYIISPPQSGVITYFHQHYPKLFPVDLRFTDFSKPYVLTVPKGKEIALIIDVGSVNHEILGQKISIIDKLKKMVFNDKNPLKKIIFISIFSPKEVISSFNENEKKVIFLQPIFR